MVFALLLMANPSAKAQQIIRIGVIDHMEGSIARAAQLAAKHINDAGGLAGANGTRSEIVVAVTSPDYMDIAAANMRQADVIAVLGPNSPDSALATLSQLGDLSVPVFTTVSSDSLLLQDTSGRVFRSVASDLVQSRALATYLVQSQGASRITTIQLDAASTSSLIGFASALSEVGAGVSNLLYDEIRNDLGAIANQVAARQPEPEALVIYGPPLLAAQSYNQLRSAGFAGLVSYSQAMDPRFTSIVPTDSLPGILVTAPWSFTSSDALSRQFVWDFASAFGTVPDAISAASYDAVGLLAAAYRRPGNLADNIAALQRFAGVQGSLSPGTLPRGETSANVMISEINEFGTPNAVASYRGTTLRAEIRSGVATATPTAQPSPTASGYHLTIRSTYQNVRSGPGLNFDVIGQLPRGTKARVIGATDDFSWLVIDFRGQWGWLAAYLVDAVGNRNLVPIILPPPTPTPPATATIAPPSLADLVIVDAYPARVTLDQQMIVNVIVANQGLAPAGPFAIATSFQPGGRYAAVNLPGLAARQQATVQLGQNLNGATGPQSVIIVADLNDEVFEGDAGEANNRSYAYNYIADREVINSGTWTGNSGLLDLDRNGNVDLSWSGTDLIALNGSMYLMGDFRTIDDAHHDAIGPNLAHASAFNASLLPEALIGFFSSEGGRGVIQVLGLSDDGALTLAYRMYR
ncbi:MAG: ABC transporter substrate-binding protein [Chloroflexi bacterium]|nr:ABC transporter substrate-binding protein [Chloroflexota bacterium]